MVWHEEPGKRLAVQIVTTVMLLAVIFVPAIIWGEEAFWVVALVGAAFVVFGTEWVARHSGWRRRR
jgi:hypothetical protein